MCVNKGARLERKPRKAKIRIGRETQVMKREIQRGHVVGGQE